MLASQRELNILSKNNKGISPLQISKINSERQKKLDHEQTENEVKQRQTNCLSIYNSLQEYQSNPKEIKSQFRKKLKLKGLNYKFIYFNEIYFNKKKKNNKIEIGEIEMDEILCREAFICGDIIKFKKYLNSNINLEKKSDGTSITDLISKSLNFELLQELPKSIVLDLNFNDIQLSKEKSVQLSQFIQKTQKLRSLRFFFLFLFFFYFNLSNK